MIKNNWFLSYCEMSNDEKWFYREYEMSKEKKIQLHLYIQMYDVVSLMAADYENQTKALPQTINIADEVALLFNDEVIAVRDDLYQEGMLSCEAYLLIDDINQTLSSMEGNQNLWTLDAMKKSNLWEECRQKAKKLRDLLYDIKN